MNNIFIIIVILVYLLSVGINFLILRKTKLDNDDKTLIFMPIINTISLVIELWDYIFKKR